MMRAAISVRPRQRGFTLAELAIVMIIVGLLLGSLLGTYSTQIELSRISDTKRTLETARDALLGFAAANGRLPCPATSTSNGVEAPVGGGACTVASTAGGGQPGLGFVPAATLSLSPVDNQGYLLDAWGARIRYAVTNSNSSEFTTQGQIRVGLLDLVTTTPSPDLRICSTATGMTGAGTSGVTCAAGASLTTSATAVIFSIGKNGVTSGGGADESKNLDNDAAFISHEPAPADATNGEFDDVVVWLSPSILYSRILSGAL